jgi:hypothetical protein
MSVENSRIFPRYTVIQLRPKLVLSTLENAEFLVKDISLNGIQILSKSKIILKSYNQVYFKFSEKESYKLNISQVWQQENPTLEEAYRVIMKENFKDIYFRSGFNIKFTEQDDFQKWSKLIQAIHHHQKKKYAF